MEVMSYECNHVYVNGSMMCDGIVASLHHVSVNVEIVDHNRLSCDGHHLIVVVIFCDCVSVNRILCIQTIHESHFTIVLFSWATGVLSTNI